MGESRRTPQPTEKAIARLPTHRDGTETNTLRLEATRFKGNHRHQTAKRRDVATVAPIDDSGRQSSLTFGQRGCRWHSDVPFLVTSREKSEPAVDAPASQISRAARNPVSDASTFVGQV